jgi:signal transduction histidine kinase
MLYLSALNTVLTNLAHSHSVDSLCYQAVKGLLEEFGIDRCGVLLYDAKTQQQVGTWGTDKNGQLRQETDLRFPVQEHLVMTPEQGQCGMVILEDHPLQELGEVIARGWHIQCGIFDNDTLLGWLFVDNLVNQLPLENDQVDLIRTFATAFGQMLVKFQQNEELLALNHSLESQNDYLEKTLKYLANAQERLIEGEKMAALGKLVQGVAHELNTPLGNSMMAISQFRFSLEDCQVKIREGSLRMADALSTIDDLAEATRIAECNVNRASDLITQFKKIAIADEFDHIDRVDVTPFVQQLVNMIRDILPGFPETVSFDIEGQPEDLTWTLLPGAFSQVLTHLISNAQRHGLKQDSGGKIRIRIDTYQQNTRRKLRIVFSDNGVGVDDDTLKVIFDPFYTTNRQIGTGLGTSIVYNLVTHRMGGFIRAEHNPTGGLQFEILLPDVENN